MCVYIMFLLIYSSVDRLELFLLLGFVDNIAMNMNVHECEPVWVLALDSLG